MISTHACSATIDIISMLRPLNVFHVLILPTVSHVIPLPTVWTVSKATMKVALVLALNAIRTAQTVSTPHIALNATTLSISPLVFVHLVLLKDVYHATAQTTVSIVLNRCGKMLVLVLFVHLLVCSALPALPLVKAVSLATTRQGSYALHAQE